MATIVAPERTLTQSFRFGPNIAILASEILRALGERTPVRGRENIGSLVVLDPSVQPPVDAVLCRKNVTAILIMRRDFAHKRPVLSSRA